MSVCRLVMWLNFADTVSLKGVALTWMRSSILGSYQKLSNIVKIRGSRQTLATSKARSTLLLTRS